MVRCIRVLTDTDEERVVSLPEFSTDNEYEAFWSNLDFCEHPHNLIGCVWLLDGDWLDYECGEMGYKWVRCSVPVIPPAMRRNRFAMVYQFGSLAAEIPEGTTDPARGVVLLGHYTGDFKIG
jgi:hypothetical protein